jgi:type II secretory pathway predicted ATPase ExeA
MARSEAAAKEIPVEHLQHFGLSQDPFSNESDLRFYFESATHLDAQRRVERGLRQRKGLTLLTGEGGMGKSLLARRILESLEEEVFEATLLVMLPGAADATGILQRFARQLGVDEPAGDRAGLLAQIYEQLAIVREDGRHAVLMIDDAQIMTPDVFAELSGLLNLEYEDRRLLSMLFVGSPELDQLVENDPAVGPRIDVRVQMRPLSIEHAAAYVAHRLAAVQGSPELIPPPALEALFKFGRGRPRLINTLADNALFEAYLASRTVIEPGDVERAAADLGVGVDPGTTYRESVSSDSVAMPAPASSPPPAPSVAFDEGASSIEPESSPSVSFDSSSADSIFESEPEAALVMPEAAPVAATEWPTTDEPEALDWDAPTGIGEAEVTLEEPPEPTPELELTSVVPEPEIGEAAFLEAQPLEPEAGFEAAIAELGEPLDAPSAPVESAPWELDGLDFEEAPMVAEAAEAEPLDAALETQASAPPMAAQVLSAEELAEVDELDDVFVELIEE